MRSRHPLPEPKLQSSEGAVYVQDQRQLERTLGVLLWVGLVAVLFVAG